VFPWLLPRRLLPVDVAADSVVAVSTPKRPRCRHRRCKFPLAGELLDLEWLSQDGAVRLAPEIFGLWYCFDNDDKVIWSYPPETA
jgi:hypothetical protein